MPEDDLVRCPACGFRVKADEEVCSYCGYEFKDTLDAQHAVQSVSLQSPAYTEAARKVSPRNPRKRNSKAKEVKVEPPVEDTHEKIRKLEEQLSEAEKELDEISRMLSSPAAAATINTQAAPVPQPAPATHQLTHSVTVQAPPLQTPVAPVHPDVSKEHADRSTRLFFMPRIESLVALVAGLAVYALAFFYSTVFTVVQTYLMLIPGSVLVAVGLYFSFESRAIYSS